MQLKHVFCAFLCLPLSVHSVTSVVYADVPTPSFLIGELKKYEKNMDRVSVDFHCTIPSSKSSIGSSGSFKYGNGNYWKIKRGSETPDSLWTTELSHIGDQYEVTVTKLKDHPPALSATVEGEGFMPVQNELVFYPLFGYIDAYDKIVRILELLEDMSLSTETDNGNNFQDGACVLNGKNSKSDISIWFERKNHYVPVRFLVTPTGHPFLISCDYQFDDFHILDGIPYPHKLTVTRERFFFPYLGKDKGLTEKEKTEAIVRDLKKWNRLPKKIDLTKIREYKLTTTAEYTFSNVRVKQNFSLEDFSITTDLKEKEGGSIFVRNAPHLPHNLYEGKPVPLYDPTIYEVSGLAFLSDPMSPRFWFTWIGLLMIVGALTHKGYAFFKNGRGDDE